MNHNVYSSKKDSKFSYNNLSDEYKDKIKNGFWGSKVHLNKKIRIISLHI